MKRNKQTLAFDQLEAEMELITKDELLGYKGGDGSGMPADCVFQAVAFATGRSVEEVTAAYGTYKANSTGFGNVTGASGVYEFLGTTQGLSIEDGVWLAHNFGLTNDGDTPQGATGTSMMGDQSVAFLDNGNGNGHAIVLTGNASYTDYYYYDPQSQTTGTISKTDPRIIGTYGY